MRDNSFFMFSFRVAPELSPKWYKFDDGEVSECKMDDDEVPWWFIFCLKLSTLLLTTFLSSVN